MIVDDDLVVHDSTAIADHLEDRYPDRPALFGGEIGRACSLRAELERDRIAAGAHSPRPPRHPPPLHAGGSGLFLALARRAVCDPVRIWRGRMLDLFDGLARSAPAYGD